ncbi:MAG: hypothetical protein ACYDB3_00935, partial [Acidimicrobiales bacterium]
DIELTAAQDPHDMIDVADIELLPPPPVAPPPPPVAPPPPSVVRLVVPPEPVEPVAAAPAPPEALVYIPTSGVTSGASLHEPDAEQSVEVSQLPEQRPEPEPQRDPEPVLVGVATHPFESSAAMASEILATAHDHKSRTEDVARPASTMISEDLTLISKSRKKRLQFRLR